MASQYFKTRKSFDFKAHAYALGNIMGVRPGYEDNHFLLKLYSLDEALYEDYYGYHLDYYLSTSAGNKEKDFFTHIWYIVSDRIAYFQGRDPFSLKHALYLSNIDKLKTFQSFLSPKDQWNIRPNDVLLKEKDELIAKICLKIFHFDWVWCHTIGFHYLYQLILGSKQLRLLALLFLFSTSTCRHRYILLGR